MYLEGNPVPSEPGQEKKCQTYVVAWSRGEIYFWEHNIGRVPDQQSEVDTLSPPQG